MKMFKKVSSFAMALLCTAILTMSFAATAFAAEEITEEEEAIVAEAENAPAASETDYLKMQAEQLVTSIIQLDDASIDQAIENYPDDPSIAAVESWKTSKEEVGAFKEVGNTEVEEDDDAYVITVPISFEKNPAEFEIVVDKKAGSLTSAAFNVKYSLAENMKRAALNTLMGLGTVFIVLTFLIWVIGLFKYIPNGSNKKTAPVPAPVPAPAAAVPAAEEETDDTELVAVIAAAIAAAEGTTPDGFVVRSIRRVNRGRR